MIYDWSHTLDLPEKYLIDFYLPDCAPCQNLFRILPKWSDDNGVDIVKIDASLYPELAERFAVKKVPTFILVKEGVEADRITGVPRLTELTAMVTD